MLRNRLEGTSYTNLHAKNPTLQRARINTQPTWRRGVRRLKKPIPFLSKFRSPTDLALTALHPQAPTKFKEKNVYICSNSQPQAFKKKSRVRPLKHTKPHMTGLKKSCSLLSLFFFLTSFICLLALKPLGFMLSSSPWP